MTISDCARFVLQVILCVCVYLFYETLFMKPFRDTERLYWGRGAAFFLTL